MAEYRYIASDEKGNRFSGTYKDVESLKVLRAQLTKIGYKLIKARKARLIRRKRFFVRQRDIVAFAYQFAGMYAAGLSVVQCLETLERQTRSASFKYVLADIRENVETGSSLKKAFGRYEYIFSSFFTGMVEAGESGAKLANSLEMSARYLEKRLDLKQRVCSAFVYPSMVGLVSFIVIGSLLAFVVPMFSRLYEKLHVPLPVPTQIVVMLSHVIRDYWFFMVVGILAAVYGIQRLLTVPVIRARVDRLKLKVPIFGRLNQMVMVSRFIRTLATLVNVGVPLIEALEISNVVAHNSRMSEITRELQDSVRAGNPIARSMARYAVFPPMVVQMADSGEQAGVLDRMLSKAADFIDKDIDRMVSNMMVKLEPMITLTMGLIVGMILIGVYLPMFDYMNHLK